MLPLHGHLLPLKRHLLLLHPDLRTVVRRLAATTSETALLMAAFLNTSVCRRECDAFECASPLHCGDKPFAWFSLFATCVLICFSGMFSGLTLGLLSIGR